MSEYNIKNYTEQGGDVTHIGGKIILEEGGEAIGFGGGSGGKGDKGDKGDDGKSAYEIAVENGFSGTEVEWLASLKGEKGDAGADGAKGDKGDIGATPNLTIGTVASDSVASASITGTAENPVLNLTLPKGDKGNTGAGKTFQIGTVTQGDTPSVTLTDVNDVVTLNFVLP